MHLFYTPDINGEFYTLNEEESKHAVRVLRLVPGTIVQLVDGKGGFYTAEVLSDHPKKCLLKVIDLKKEYQKRNCYLHVAVAPTKNMERLEWFLEKATEIGIDEISPIICQRSERKDIKTERLDKLIVAAMKQSIKAYKPVINELQSLNKFIAAAHKGAKLIAHCEDGEKSFITRQIDNCYTILIGPEGDFSPEEIQLACAKGFEPITLGTSRLRTETAALAACMEVNLLHR